MKHILIFSANYLPNTGGVERYVFNLSKELSSRGNKITIVTSNVFNLKDYELLSDNIEIFRFPCINLLDGRFPVLKFWSKKFKELNKQLIKRQNDLTIVNTRFYLHSLYGAKIGKKYSKKVIAIEHGSAHLTVNSKFWDFCGHIFEHFITSLIKTKIKDFYGVSTKCNEWLKHFNIKAKGVTYNAVDIDDIIKIKKANQKFDLQACGISSTDILVAFSGRLVLEKGILVLINSIRLLNEKYKRNDIHLLVAGNGPLEMECKKAANSNVHFLGKLPFEQVVSALSVSSIFCLPTIYPEGFPTSILEAAVLENYIIVTPTSGIDELILDSSYGTVLSANPTSEEIAEAILNIADNSKNQKIACKKCLDRVKSSFTWKQTADKIESILNQN